MLAKLSITTRCGARCATCPVWKGPQLTMPFERFCTVWDQLMADPLVNDVTVNGTGDVTVLPDAMRYLVYIETHKAKHVTMITNAAALSYVPAVDNLTISFNGSNPENYRATTGLSFEKVVARIRAAYPQLARIPHAEIDTIIWQGNAGSEDEWRRLWADFPGTLRVSYKVENQHGEYFGLEEYRDENRIPCDYLDMLIIAPTGQVICCNHDFAFATDYGCLPENSIFACAQHPAKQALKDAHRRGEYPGLCADCNYNVRTEGKLFHYRRVG